MLLVQLGINNTRDVWKFCQIGLAPAARTINPSLVLLIPNCTRQRMITYTNFSEPSFLVSYNTSTKH